MFQYAMRFFLRHIRSNKLMTLVTLSGLVVGMTAVILIGFFVTHELSYDRFHPDSERTVLITTHAKFSGGRELDTPLSSTPMAIDLAREINEIENWVRVNTNMVDVQVQAGENKSVEPKIYHADSTFFSVFGYQLAQGDPATALSQKNSIVLTRDCAHRLFGNEDPIGKEVVLFGSSKMNVTGIFADVSKPSHLEGFSGVVSWSTFGRRDDAMWLSSINYLTYLKTRPGTDLDALVIRMNQVAEEKLRPVLDQIGGEFSLGILPLEQIYLHSNFEFNMYKMGSISYVIQFVVIGLVILLIAVLNYINLTTARSLKRGRQVGISKSLGASRGQLVRMFLQESLIISGIAVLLSLLAADLLLPSFNNLLGLELSFSQIPLTLFAGVLVGFALLIGLLAGLYPSFVLSAFKPLQVMRGQLRTGRKGTWLRSSLVVLQFTISVALIIGTLIVMKQLDYVRHKDLGYNREHVLAINLPSRTIRSKHEMIEHEMGLLPGVIQISSADQLPTEWSQNSVFHIPGTALEEQLMMNVLRVDHRYIQMMELELVDGRGFDAAIGSDSSAIVINQTCARKLGWDHPVGQVIEDYTGESASDTRPLPVIGVVKDFHVETLHTEIYPMMLQIYRGDPLWLFFRVAPGSTHEVMARLDQVWEDASGGVVPLRYEFLDDMFDKRYRTELRMSSLFTIFTGLAIFIACLGLFALAAFSAEQRRKEIGIRKVLGATEREIIQLLTIQFIKLVAIANLVAWPLAWLAMQKWLEGFAYHIDLGVSLFLGAGILSIVIAVLTVSAQAIRAAWTNPVQAIRYE